MNRRTGENSIDRYTLPCGKQIASGKLLYNRGSPAWHPVMTPRSGMGMGREAKEGEGYIYIYTTDLRCHKGRNKYNIVKQSSSN